MFAVVSCRGAVRQTAVGRVIENIDFHSFRLFVFDNSEMMPTLAYYIVFSQTEICLSVLCLLHGISY